MIMCLLVATCASIDKDMYIQACIYIYIATYNSYNLVATYVVGLYHV